MSLSEMKIYRKNSGFVFSIPLFFIGKFICALLFAALLKLYVITADKMSAAVIGGGCIFVISESTISR